MNRYISAFALSPLVFAAAAADRSRAPVQLVRDELPDAAMTALRHSLLQVSHAAATKLAANRGSMVRREPGSRSSTKAMNRTLDHERELIATTRTRDVPEVGERDCCGGCDFTLSDDYSHTLQGARHWYYLAAPPGSDEYDEMYASEVTISPEHVIKHWRFSKTDVVNIQERGRIHPSKHFDAVFAWDAPGDGVAKISGVASDTDTRCGDGVHFIIKMTGGNVLWEQRSANEGAVHPFKVQAVLKKGDMLFFRTSSDGAAETSDDHDCDSASFAPTIAFEEACAKKSDQPLAAVDAAATGPDDDDDLIGSKVDDKEDDPAMRSAHKRKEVDDEEGGSMIRSADKRTEVDDEEDGSMISSADKRTEVDDEEGGSMIRSADKSTEVDDEEGGSMIRSADKRTEVDDEGGSMIRSADKRTEAEDEEDASQDDGRMRDKTTRSAHKTTQVHDEEDGSVTRTAHKRTEADDGEDSSVRKSTHKRREAMKAEATEMADDVVGALDNATLHSQGGRASLWFWFLAMIPALATH